MTEEPIQQFDFDAGDVVPVLQDTLAGADDGELFLETALSESLVFDDGRLKAANFDSSRGFGLRCVSGEAFGYAHSCDPTLAAVKRAGEAVAAVKRGHAGMLADAPVGTNRKLYDAIDPVARPGFETKSALLQEIDAYCRTLDSSVVQVSVSIAGSKQSVTVLRADGDTKTDIRPLVRLNVAITVERDGRRETGSAGAGGRAEFDRWIAPDAWKPMADEALRIARVNLDAVDAPAGVFDVVLGPG